MRFFADAASLVRALARQKAALAVILLLSFCVPYFTLQHVVLMPVRTLPVIWIDDAIRFDPGRVWIYQSGYRLIAMVPWMFDTPESLARYARGFSWTACLGFVCFLAFPIAGPRPEVVPATGMFASLAWYDRPTNEFPSLHVGLMTYSLVCGARASQGRMAARPRAWLLVAGAAWAVAVSYAAVATKQHYAIDLPAGAFVGWLAYRRSWS